MLYRKFKPNWLYELLPYIYAVIGVVTIVVLQNIMSVISGLALISAGGYVWTMRWSYRRSPRRRYSGGATAKGETANTGLVRLVWRDSYDCGYPTIDTQHRQLFELGNELINAILGYKPKQAVEMLLDELIEHIVDHFRTEEALLVKIAYPLSSAHQDSHRILLERARGLEGRYRRGELVVGELVSFITYDVIAQHVVKDDLKFSPTVVKDS